MKLKQWFEKLADSPIIPTLWGILWILIITAISMGVLFWSVKWIFKLFGVI